MKLLGFLSFLILSSNILFAQYDTGVEALFTDMKKSQLIAVTYKGADNYNNNLKEYVKSKLDILKICLCRF